MKSYGFVQFCKENEKRIISTIARTAKSIPPKMNLPDYRFNLNNMFCHSLTKEFSLGGEGGTLASSYNRGYDMLFADSIRVSVKIQKEIFQREMKNGKMTVPKNLIMKNCLGKDNSGKTKLDLDYLLAIQRGTDKGLEISDIAFAVISVDKIDPIVEGDQVKVKIYCDKCDFCSDLYEVSMDKSPDRLSELNRVFSEGLASTYDKLMGIE